MWVISEAEHHCLTQRRGAPAGGRLCAGAPTGLQGTGLCAGTAGGQRDSDREGPGVDVGLCGSWGPCPCLLVRDGSVTTP